MRRAAIGSVALTVLALLGSPAMAHDLKIPLDDLERGAARVEQTLLRLAGTPVVPKPPATVDEQRRVLGEAEIELMLGNRKRALEMLLGRLADPAFAGLPEYVETLLLASQILETLDEPSGAMAFSRQALEHGGTPLEMAEAGARWFRISRVYQILDERLQVLELWRRKGGAAEAGEEATASAAYEAAFALKTDHQLDEAQRMLATVPSDSAYGSRAAYLAGVLHVEKGDLGSAERWFSAITEWALPDRARDPNQKEIEVEVRELAALSAARLRYERGDLDGADEAYAKIPDGSGLQTEACYERAYLALERKQKRDALNEVQCLLDLGAGGDRYIDVRLMKASILAHLARYEESVEDYQVLFNALTKEGALVKQALAGIEKPADFLFAGMERSTLTQNRRATPGPATIFGDAWTPGVDRGYRLSRDLGDAEQQLENLTREIDQISQKLEAEDAFFPFRNREHQYRMLLRDIKHLNGHAVDLVVTVPHRHAAATELPADDEHQEDARLAAQIAGHLDQDARLVETALAQLAQDEQQKRDQTTAALASIRAEAEGLTRLAKEIAADASAPIDAEARQALQAVVARFENAVMRAEAGVLDTFWVKKEHVSEQIRGVVLEKEAVKHEYEDAFQDFYKEGL